ncbi:hypothetical protein BP6252_04544 [Coleophoma cylindrospora]|uniref:Uncharacterized protein n=1 Tax=Coleophoma cylindrospora TaxID=1849047 RepID=A0A3D8S0W2_9HELO|nr:hypothetical protein BP6252_04544 [Coleophoma cylindrospora]
MRFSFAIDKPVRLSVKQAGCQSRYPSISHAAGASVGQPTSRKPVGDGSIRRSPDPCCKPASPSGHNLGRCSPGSIFHAAKGLAAPLGPNAADRPQEPCMEDECALPIRKPSWDPSLQDTTYHHSTVRAGQRRERVNASFSHPTPQAAGGPSTVGASLGVGVWMRKLQGLGFGLAEISRSGNLLSSELAVDHG